MLQHRLDAGELTYARYLATSQQVFSSALDNLHEVAVASESISTIDETYIDRRLTELASDDSDPEAAERERATLERRREMRATQRRSIAQLLAQNESALTALDRTTTALADVPIGKKPDDADAAMAELEALADRAGRLCDLTPARAPCTPTTDRRPRPSRRIRRHDQRHADHARRPTH